MQVICTDSHQSETTSRNPQSWLLAACLAIACFGAYLSSYGGAFVYDDGLCLIQRAALDEWWPEKLSTGSRRWFTHLTFVANYKLHGYWLPGYHFVNNAIHFVAGLLLFGLVRRGLVIGKGAAHYARSASWLALAVAAIWLVHPLQTQSVTYIVQRLESLAGMFFLLSLYALVRGSQSQRPWPWYLLMLLAVYIGFGAKETMFVLPLVALALDRCLLAASWREVLRQRWWVYLGMTPALVWAAYMVSLTSTPTPERSLGFGYHGVTSWEYLRSQPGVILNYLRLCFWPSGQCLDYWWAVENDPWRIYGLGAVIVALLAATAVLLWYRPRLGFLGLAFFVILAPTSSIIPIRDLAFEHRMYLPLAAVVILAVLAFDELCRRSLHESRPRVVIPASILSFVVLGLALCTSQRNKVYHDPVWMWQDVVNKAPHSDRAQYNLGQSLANRELAGGLPRYRHLLIFDAPALGKDLPDLGILPFTADMRRAIDSFEKSLAIYPQQSSAYFNIGGLYDRTGQWPLAIEAYQKELKNNPPHLHARINLSRLLAKHDRLEEAIAQCREAARLHPQDSRPHVQLGILLAQQGQPTAALACYARALEINPTLISAKYRSALARWDLGEQREAIAALRELRLTQRHLFDVNLALARFLATTTELDLHHPEEGAAIAQQVIDQQGASLAEAWETLAICLAGMQRYDDAARKLERAIELAERNREATKVAALQELKATWNSPVKHDGL